ncbi:hypothetical protein [Streptomyces sp. 3N207]|uniref:hypothetical protein n=1 Tax=Streptomyces sp. 3N207 TaxID=3457417 RepID=UPI003FCF7907
MTRPDDWMMPAFLAQLAAPGVQLVRAVSDGRETVYLFDADREAFATLTADGEQWNVRQGGPVAVWDAIESAVTGWRQAGEPDITSVRMEVTIEAHTYWIGEEPALRWKHAQRPLAT